MARLEIAEYGTGRRASMRRWYRKRSNRNQIGADRGDAKFLPRSLGLLIGIRGTLQRVKSDLCLFQDIAVRVFPSTQEKKRQRSSQGPKLGFARNFDLGLPAKELRRNEKSENSPNGEGQKLNQELRDGKRLIKGARERVNKVGSWQKQADMLDGGWQLGKSELGAIKND